MTIINKAAVKKSAGQPQVTALEVATPKRMSVKKFMDTTGAFGPGGKPPKKVPINNGQPGGAGKALQSLALDREVVFGSLYQQEGMSGALRPPYDPDKLSELIEENNALNPCIEAMETNIDGTGFEIIAEDPDVEVPDEVITRLGKFFMQPWPHTTFMAMRKRLRRDLEATGNAYIEVIRTFEGQVALMRRLDPCVTRIMRLGGDSFDEEIYSAVLNAKVKVSINRRRYVQYVYGKLVYFKEFGAPLDLDRITGRWADEKSNFNIDNRANEIIHLICQPHHASPYGLPRWISQIPSVVGSRKAEEFNLGFFDQGGVPPMMIVIQGGQAADNVETAIKNLFYSAGPNKTTAAILQVQGTDGTIDDPGRVSVTVERFGQDRQKDQMFQNYDETCAEKVRRAFRLPEMFIGNVRNLNYASALASYRVAEAQVFKTERDQFDETITNTILNEIIGQDMAGTIRFRSMPITAKDMDQQIKALTLAAQTQAITSEELVDNLNEVTGLAMTAATPEERAVVPTSVPGHPDEAAIRDTRQSASDQITHERTLEQIRQTKELTEGGIDGSNVTASNSGSIITSVGKTEYPRLPSRAVSKSVKKRSISKEEISDLLAEDAANGLIAGRSREVFDSVTFMDANPEQRNHLSKQVAKRLFCCGPGEEEAASRLAEALLYSTQRAL